MVSVSRLIGGAVLVTWLVSLAVWFYIFIIIMIGEGDTDIDFWAPIIQGLPFFTYLNTGILLFVLGYACMVLYFAYWYRPKNTSPAR
jgi:hypothetical protein